MALRACLLVSSITSILDRTLCMAVEMALKSPLQYGKGQIRVPALEARRWHTGVKTEWVIPCPWYQENLTSARMV
jgi:hypothetical protein